MSDQDRAPLFEALCNYADTKVIPFHVPGHKQGRAGDAAFSARMGSAALSIDLTSMEELDFLSNPKSVIAEAEVLAAKAFGADHAFFLCNGTSSGIQTMLIAACQPGDKVLIPRNAHKSVIGGVIFSGAEPVYMQPELNDYLGIAMGITPETVIEAIDNNPDAKTLFLINPTYYGMVSDLRRIVEICHERGLLVLVDEAHGGHFHFHQDMPLSAMAAGADIAAISTHKLTGSLTQSSLLVMKDNDSLKPSRVRSVLNLLQTTSPSYILMASLDTARREMAVHGEQLISNLLNLSAELRRELEVIQGLYAFGPDLVGKPGCYDFDSSKLSLCARGLGISGYEFEQILRQECNLQVELSDFYNVLAVMAIGDTRDLVAKLKEACCYVAEKYNRHTLHNAKGNMPAIPELVVSPRFAYYSETVAIPFEESEGEVSAELIMAYPPGIPIICPGERLTWEIIRYIQAMREAGLNIQGTEDPEVHTIKVLRRNLTSVYSKGSRVILTPQNV